MKFTRIATVAVAVLFMIVAVQSAYAQSISMERIKEQEPQPMLSIPEKDFWLC